MFRFYNMPSVALATLLIIGQTHGSNAPNEGDGRQAERQLAESTDMFRTVPGSPVADYIMGKRHYFGDEVEKNWTKALDFFQKAATKGSAKARFYLAALLSKEQGGIQANPVAAFNYLREAAVIGHTCAQEELAGVYLLGRGPCIELQGFLNINEGLRWYSMCHPLITGDNIWNYLIRSRIRSITKYCPSQPRQQTYGPASTPKKDSPQALLCYHIDQLAQLDENMDSPQFDRAFQPIFTTLRNYTWELTMLRNTLQRSPVLVTLFSVENNVPQTLTYTEEPPFIFRQHMQGVTYLTLGVNNVKKIRNMSTLISPKGGFDFRSKTREEISQHLANPEIAVGDTLHNIIKDRPISLFGDACCYLQFIESVYARTQEIILSNPDNQGLNELRSHKFRERELWFARVRALLIQTVQSIYEDIKNVGPRNEACVHDDAYKTLKDLHEVPEWTWANALVVLKKKVSDLVEKTNRNN